jgi:hypothetical protein
MGGACSPNGKKRNACRLLVRESEGKSPQGRPRRTWLDNVKMDIGETGWDAVDWIGLAQDGNSWRALVNAVMNIGVPYIAGKFPSCCMQRGDGRRLRAHLQTRSNVWGVSTGFSWLSL